MKYNKDKVVQTIQSIQKRFYITNVPEEKLPFLNLASPWLRQRSVFNPFRYLFGKYYHVQQLKFGTVTSRLLQKCLTLEILKGLDYSKTQIKVKLFNKFTIGRWVYYSDEGALYSCDVFGS